MENAIESQVDTVVCFGIVKYRFFNFNTVGF